MEKLNKFHWPIGAVILASSILLGVTGDAGKIIALLVPVAFIMLPIFVTAATFRISQKGKIASAFLKGSGWFLLAFGTLMLLGSPLNNTLMVMGIALIVVCITMLIFDDFIRQKQAD